VSLYLTGESMILLLALTFFGILLSLIYGWMMEFILVKFFGFDNSHDLHFSITILLGLAFLSGLLGIWSFYWGVSTRAVAFFSALAFLAIIVIRKYAFVRLKTIYGQLSSLGPVSWLILTLFATYAFYFAATATPIYDTGLYHAQTIHWIEFYHVVPGLANLHTRLGFNSTIFLLAAFFGFGWNFYQIAGLIIFVSMTIYCLTLIEKSRRNPAFSGIMSLGIFAFLLFDQRALSWLASPTTDLPCAMVSWLIFLLAIDEIESGHLPQLNLKTIAIIALSLFDVSIKLSSVPIILIAIYFLWKVQALFSVKRALVLVAFSAVLFLPWIARNIVLTGYLIFPFSEFDIFSFDWKVSPEVVKDLASAITSWGRAPYEDANLVMSLKLNEWLPGWYQTLPRNDLFLVNALLIGLFLIPVFAAIKKRVAKQIQANGLVYAVCFIGVVFWFVESPSPRFGYGFLVMLLWLIYAPLAISLLDSIKLSNKWFILLAQSLVVVCILNVLVQFPLNSWRHYLNTHKPYPAVETNSVKLGDQAVFLPVSGDQCWYVAFPCAPSIVPGLRMRGTNIEDGFYVSEK